MDIAQTILVLSGATALSMIFYEAACGKPDGDWWPTLGGFCIVTVWLSVIAIALLWVWS